MSHRRNLILTELTASEGRSRGAWGARAWARYRRELVLKLRASAAVGDQPTSLPPPAKLQPNDELCISQWLRNGHSLPHFVGDAALRDAARLGSLLQLITWVKDHGKSSVADIDWASFTEAFTSLGRRVPCEVLARRWYELCRQVRRRFRAAIKGRAALPPAPIHIFLVKLMPEVVLGPSPPKWDIVASSLPTIKPKPRYPTACRIKLCCSEVTTYMLRRARADTLVLEDLDPAKLRATLSFDSDSDVEEPPKRRREEVATKEDAKVREINVINLTEDDDKDEKDVKIKEVTANNPQIDEKLVMKCVVVLHRLEDQAAGASGEADDGCESPLTEDEESSDCGWSSDSDISENALMAVINREENRYLALRSELTPTYCCPARLRRARNDALLRRRNNVQALMKIKTNTSHIKGCEVCERDVKRDLMCVLIRLERTEKRLDRVLEPDLARNNVIFRSDVKCAPKKQRKKAKKAERNGSSSSSTSTEAPIDYAEWQRQRQSLQKYFKLAKMKPAPPRAPRAPVSRPEDDDVIIVNEEPLPVSEMFQVKKEGPKNIVRLHRNNTEPVVGRVTPTVRAPKLQVPKIQGPSPLLTVHQGSVVVSPGALDRAGLVLTLDAQEPKKSTLLSPVLRLFHPVANDSLQRPQKRVRRAPPGLIPLNPTHESPKNSDRSDQLVLQLREPSAGARDEKLQWKYYKKSPNSLLK